MLFSAAYGAAFGVIIAYKVLVELNNLPRTQQVAQISTPNIDENEEDGSYSRVHSTGPSRVILPDFSHTRKPTPSLPDFSCRAHSTPNKTVRRLKQKGKVLEKGGENVVKGFSKKLGLGLTVEDRNTSRRHGRVVRMSNLGLPSFMHSTITSRKRRAARFAYN